MAVQAIGNPEEIEAFARQLKQATATLTQTMSRLNGQFSRLGTTSGVLESTRSSRDAAALEFSLPPQDPRDAHHVSQ